MSTPKMRTIKETISELKAIDSNTAFTEYALRTAIKTGAIPHIQAGNKILVNFDTVQRYLNGELIIEQKPETGKIRQITA